MSETPNIHCPHCGSTDVECSERPHVHRCESCGFDGSSLCEWCLYPVGGHTPSELASCRADIRQRMIATEYVEQEPDQEDYTLNEREQAMMDEAHAAVRQWLASESDPGSGR